MDNSKSMFQDIYLFVDNVFLQVCGLGVQKSGAAESLGQVSMGKKWLWEEAEYPCESGPNHQGP